MPRFALVDTRSAFPDLTTEEENTYLRLVDQAKADTLEAAIEQREIWAYAVIDTEEKRSGVEAKAGRLAELMAQVNAGPDSLVPLSEVHSPLNLHSLCIAILGRPPLGKFGKVQVERALEGGMSQLTTQSGFPKDPEATAILDGIVTAELIQVIGRLRHVNSGEPIEITVYGDTNLTLGEQVLPVQNIEPWAKTKKPDPLKMQLDEGGIAFLSGVNAHKAYPKLFKNLKQARNMLKRHINKGDGESGVRAHSSIIYYYRGLRP